MKRSSKLIGLAIVGAVAAASGTAALADSKRHEHRYEQSKRYEMHQRDRDQRRDGDARSMERKERIERREREQERDRDSRRDRTHWRVSSASYDGQGRLTGLQHLVPLHDMVVFARISQGLAANGLQMQWGKAVYHTGDAQVHEPHVHYTQRFSVAG
jgi:hypothetical protein